MQGDGADGVLPRKRFLTWFAGSRTCSSAAGQKFNQGGLVRVLKPSRELDRRCAPAGFGTSTLAKIQFRDTSAELDPVLVSWRASEAKFCFLLCV